MSIDWIETVRRATERHSTPFFVCAWEPVLAALIELEQVGGILPTRHWLSLKTQPVRQLVRAWASLDRGVEVVSEFEFLAALEAGMTVDRILINGVQKHTWLPRQDRPGLMVNFDSLREVLALSQRARDSRWRAGLRVQVTVERDPDEPTYRGQFGMSEAELRQAVAHLRGEGVEPEVLHFHVGTNQATPLVISEAATEALRVARRGGFVPSILDVGGGLPVEGERPSSAGVGSACGKPDLQGMRRVMDQLHVAHPHLAEVWLENGRFVTARSAILVVRVVDVKERGDSRYLLCDGGRTNHALPSDWELHDFLVLPDRGGTLVDSTVCGPTCMHYDRLFRAALPALIRPGDLIIWKNAGAYHISWETSFSKGRCAVLWVDAFGKCTVARQAESFSTWWGMWEPDSTDSGDL